MATITGTAILFGVDSTTATVTGLGAMTLLQGTDNTSDADIEQIRDTTGNTKTLCYYDHKLKASLEFVCCSTATGAGAITLSSMPSAGTTLTLTDAMNVPIAGTWLVDSCQLTGSNTKAIMARISLTKYTQNTLP